MAPASVREVGVTMNDRPRPHPRTETPDRLRGPKDRDAHDHHVARGKLRLGAAARDRAGGKRPADALLPEVAPPHLGGAALSLEGQRQGTADQPEAEDPDPLPRHGATTSSPPPRPPSAAVRPSAGTHPA